MLLYSKGQDELLNQSVGYLPDDVALTISANALVELQLLLGV
jgi:hypothetical protein